MRATIVAFASRTLSFPESAYILKAFLQMRSIRKDGLYENAFIYKQRKRAIIRSQ
jgi:hypothetical protein